MDDHKTTYESQPRRSITQWIKSQPLYDRLYALYQNTHWSARQIEPFIRKYHIDMNEFEPVNYRSFTQFFDRRFWPRVRKDGTRGSRSIRDKPIAPGAPWQNCFAETLIGTIRRECVDHVVAFSEEHLRQVLNLMRVITTPRECTAH